MRCTPFVRVPVAALLAYAAASHLSPEERVLATVVGGAVAMLSHGSKTALRAAVTPSPEPVSNIALSTGEDAAAVGLSWVAAHHPLIAGGVAAGLAVASVWAVVASVRLLRRVLRRLLGRTGGAGGAPGARSGNGGLSGATGWATGWAGSFDWAGPFDRIGRAGWSGGVLAALTVTNVGEKRVKESAVGCGVYRWSERPRVVTAPSSKGRRTSRGRRNQ